LVRSTLSSKAKTHRDVDVRVLLDTKDFKKLQKLVDIDRLSLTVSLWGQEVTGMPIDFQVQDRDYANEKYGRATGNYRSALAISGVIKGDGYDHSPTPKKPNPIEKEGE